MTDKENYVLAMDEVLVTMVKELTGEALVISDDAKVIINNAANLFLDNPGLWNMFQMVINDSHSGVLPYESATVQ